MNDTVSRAYTAILKEELVPALGCTEPIAIALTAAKARKLLGKFPEKILVRCSGNIIKNAHSVTVPTTVDMRGISTSAVLGALAGNPDQELQVLKDVKPEDIEKLKTLLEQGICSVALLDTSHQLHIIVEMTAGEESALAEIRDEHTNVVRLKKNGTIIFDNTTEEDGTITEEKNLKHLLNLSDIWEYIHTVDIEEIRDILERQYQMNKAISEEGLTNNYGCRVGRMLLKYSGNDVSTRARAAAAAGSDARMGGCVLPVIITSGSGNQGITASLPVITYAEELNVSHETLLRGLALSDLVTLLQKKEIGRLSAYCGAVCAGCGSGAAITFLKGGDLDAVCRTIINTLGNVSGIVCDGAKASCAMKIASAVEAAILGHNLAMEGISLREGDGLVKKTAEQTIESVGRMANRGMRSTDQEILQIVLEG